MDINLLRTPEGLNHYLNVVVKTLPVKLPDFMLHRFLWQKIKNDFLITEEKVDKLFVDDKINILVIETNEINIKLIIGYFHIPDDMHINSPNYVLDIINTTNEFIIDLRKLSIKNKWINNKIFLVTTFRLSGYNQIALDNFPNDIKYLYLTNSPDLKDKMYELALDVETNEFMEGDILLNNFLKYGSKNQKNYDYSKCPKCGETLNTDDDCCQTCGYPWSE